MLDETFFYRCHNSHIVNLRKVEKFNLREHGVEMSDGSTIEVTRKNKDVFMEKLKKLKV